MSEREYDRMPYVVQVEFRTASSFLVAYSVNLSRGGLFIETPSDVPAGAGITVDLTVPGLSDQPARHRRLAARRERCDAG